MPDTLNSAIPISETALQDALDSGALAIINASGDQDVLQLLHDLDALQAKKKAAGADGQVAAIQLLIACYSMRLDVGNKTEPFQPGYRLADGKVTLTPDHLTPDQVQLLAALYGEVKPAGRRARLADLVGLKIRQRRIDHVIVAIDAYTEVPVDSDHWFSGGQSHWHRALCLAASFYVGVGGRFEKIEETLVAAFEKACEDADGAEPLRYLRPLQAEQVGTHANAIAKRLQQLADAREAKGALDNAGYLYQSAAYWYGRAKKFECASVMLNARAKVTERKADRLDRGILRQHFYDDALRYYREVDGKYHAALGVREAIDRVQLKLNEAGRAAICEMQTIRVPVPDIDVSQLVDEAIAAVRGKTPREALIAFTRLDRWPSRAGYRDLAKNINKESVFATLMGSTHLAGDGRKIKAVGTLTGDDVADEDAIEVKARQLFIQEAEFRAKTELGPAMSQNYTEHALTLTDFRIIAVDSPIVPLQYAKAVAQGLYAGYQRDFVTALHILLPQFENIARSLLKNADAITTNTDRDGITNEVGLSALVTEPKLAAILGEDVVFGVNALMCAKPGPNFRNNIAHGLATSADCNTLVGLYTWWFIFRIVFIQWYLVSQPTETVDPNGAASSDTDAPPSAPAPERE